MPLKKGWKYITYSKLHPIDQKRVMNSVSFRKEKIHLKGSFYLVNKNGRLPKGVYTVAGRDVLELHKLIKPRTVSKREGETGQVGKLKVDGKEKRLRFYPMTKREAVKVAKEYRKIGYKVRVVGRGVKGKDYYLFGRKK